MSTSDLRPHARETSPNKWYQLPLHEHDEVRAFLSAVTACTNGDPILLVAGLDAEERKMPAREILSRALRDGRVERSIREHDWAYDWMNYWEYSDKGYTPLPGTFAVENPEPVLEPIDAGDLRTLWLWLVSVHGPYARNPPHGQNPRRLVDSFQSIVFGSGTVAGKPLGDLDTWRHWIVEPNFLKQIDEEPADDRREPAYFETFGTNLAWLGVGADHFLLFLLNAYPSLPAGSE